MFAGIPYTTHPEIVIGPLTIRTFGLLVAIGVMVGAWVAARQMETWGVTREETYRLATRMVIWGVIGSRITWVITNWDAIDSPMDVIAVWDGGLQFSGGFLAALIVGFPTFRRMNEKLRWRTLDSYAYGLVIGLAIGRIGCYAVGEHFGSATDFFLGTTYRGGNTQELIPLPGGALVPESQAVGATFHNTSLYELMHLFLLFGLLTLLLWRSRWKLAAGTIAGVFTIWYGFFRFVTDFSRVADNTVLGLTGAQYLSLAMIPAGVWILVKIRPRLATLPDLPPVAAAAADLDPEVDLDEVEDGTPDDAEAPENRFL